MNIMDWIAWVLVIIGGLNWGLVGLFEYDLVAEIFGGSTEMMAKIVYDIVALAALYMLIIVPMKGMKKQGAMPAAPSMPKQ